MPKLNRFAQYLDDRRGNVSILLGLLVTPVVAMAGLSVDHSRASHAQVALQRSLDASALAGAGFDGSDAEKQNAATLAFTATYDAAKHGAVTPTVSVQGDRVSVEGTTTIDTFFAAIMGHDQFTVSAASAAAAQASTGGAPGKCILLLQKKHESGLYVNSDSELDADCGVHINSKDKEALYANSNSAVLASEVCVHGKAKINSGSTVDAAPQEGCDRMDDPLATLPEPSNANASCDHEDFKVSSGESRDMYPGVYCKKTLIENGGYALMHPGTYIFRGGEFELNSGGKVTGSDVMMFFADKDAFLKVNSGSEINVSGRTSGTYQGILMFQSRDEETVDAPYHTINSDSDSKFEGVIYMPNGVLEVNSHSTSNQLAEWTAIIARRMELNSDGTFTVRSNYSDQSDTPFPPDLSEFLVKSQAALIN